MRKILTAALFAVALAPVAASAHMGDWADKDTNKDGKISKAEFEAHADKKFAELDKNGDGYITKDEMGMMHKAKADTHKAWDKTKAKAHEVKQKVENNSTPVNADSYNDQSHQ